ncbi:MAG: glycosyltransferase, partial [Alphaproteobacteria bacterium]
MRVHYFDPQLGAVDGHYVTYDSAVVAELGRRGVAYSVYGAAERKAEEAEPFEVIPTFHRQVFDEVGRDAATWALENFAVLNEAFHADLARLDPGQFEAGDIAFFPNILQNQIDGIRRWILGLPEERRPAVVLKPSYPTNLLPYMNGRSNKDSTAVLFRFAVQRLVTDHPRAAICTDTEEMVEIFERMTSVRVALMPLPLGISCAVQPSEPRDRLVCAYVGFGSAEKGFHRLPGVISQLTDLQPSLRFQIQVHGGPEFCGPVEAELRAMDPDFVEVTSGAVDREAYLDLLRKADIVLLPYEPQMYAWASSGIFVEALSLGKVVIVPEGTWMSRQGARFEAGFQTVRDLSPEALSSAVRLAVAQFAP